MNNPKVLLNACMYTKNPTGVGVNTREAYNALVQRLNANNIEYTVYAYSKIDLKNPQVVLQIKLPLFLEFFFKRFISLHRLVWNIFYLPVIAKKYDLVYSFATYGSPFIKKQVITIHDLICFQHPAQHKFQYIYFKFILPSIIKSCKKLVAVSEFTKQDVIKHFKVYANKIKVIYNGHEHLAGSNLFAKEEDFKNLENITGGKRFFFAAGASYQHKNINKVIKAMEVLPEYLLLVTGPNNAYYNGLKKLAKANNYNNIIFLNYISDSFLKLLYQKCVANIYISAYEGFGFTPLEAAIDDKISIVSNKSALPEIYEEAVMYVNPDNMDEIEHALTAVASSNFNADVYKNKFPVLFKKYSWNNMADNIMELVEECLNNKTSTINNIKPEEEHHH